MCVIIHCDKIGLSLERLQACETHNRAGGGIAWREGGTVHWQKGLDAKEIKAILDVVPFPAVIHFRLATVGGECKELCHPFPVSHHAETMLAGSFQHGVLFHNGHWTDWDLVAAAAGFKPGKKEKVSDSRVMAALVGRNGRHWLHKLTGQKLCLLLPRKVIRIGQWTEFEGVYYSNLHWKWGAGYSAPGFRGGCYGGDSCEYYQDSRFDTPLKKTAYTQPQIGDRPAATADGPAMEYWTDKQGAKWKRRAGSTAWIRADIDERPGIMTERKPLIIGSTETIEELEKQIAALDDEWRLAPPGRATVEALNKVRQAQLKLQILKRAIREATAGKKEAARMEAEAAAERAKYADEVEKDLAQAERMAEEAAAVKGDQQLFANDLGFSPDSEGLAGPLD